MLINGAFHFLQQFTAQLPEVDVRAQAVGHKGEGELSAAFQADATHFGFYARHGTDLGTYFSSIRSCEAFVKSTSIGALAREEIDPHRLSELARALLTLVNRHR